LPHKNSAGFHGMARKEANRSPTFAHVASFRPRLARRHTQEDPAGRAARPSHTLGTRAIA
ncbi:MAG TPA: hypothetical protein VKE94_19925, partial [Gemmataceae bacterium]|nr:hypothetical protein [Gemmataceae bacterium]